jgi:hypothetical protein
MRLIISEQEKKEILSSYILIESVKQAKKYVELGLLSNDILDKLITIDPSKTKKYVGWMSKIWMNENPDLDKLRNTIEQYDDFLKKGKVKTKDINQFKNFEDLYSEIDDLKQSGESVSKRDLKSDYDTVVNNEDLVIMSPHTHEASRKLGLTQFSFRYCEGGKKDSAWCTTHSAPDHFNRYYHKDMATFYYVKVKSEKMIEELKQNFGGKWGEYTVVALVVYEFSKLTGWTATDEQMDDNEIDVFLKIIGFSKEKLTPRRTDRINLHRIAELEKIEKYIENGSKGKLEITAMNTLGNLTSVDGTLKLDNCTFESLENLKNVGNLLIQRCYNLKSLGELNNVNNLSIDRCSIEFINNVTINNLFIVQNCPNLESLGELKKVNTLRINRCSNLKSLGELTFVDGNLEISDCPNLKNLGNLTSVNGNLSLSNVTLTFSYFNNLKFIVGDLILKNSSFDENFLSELESFEELNLEIRKFVNIKGRIIW